MGSKANATASFAVPPEQARKLALEAIASIGGKVKSEDRATGLVEARISLSIWSWRENMELTVEPEGAGSKVTVKSRSAKRTTLIDWGKNRRNVKRIIEYISRSAASA